MYGTKTMCRSYGIDVSQSVEERSAVGRRLSVSTAGRSRSENGGMSNENIGENPMRRKPKGSHARFVRVGLAGA